MTKRQLQKSINLWFGIRVRIYREAQRITQVSLAKQANITRTQLSHIEHGKSATTFATAYLLAKALDTKVSELLPDMKDVE